MSRSGAYKWVALSNTTLAMLLATIDASIMLIAMPDVFRGIHLDPLQPQNSFYLLWMILGYLVVTSVLVVGLGRLGDIYGRVRMYNAGFVVYTLASLLLTVNWLTGPRRRRLPDRLPGRAGDRRRVPAREHPGDPDRRLPRPTSAGSRSGSPTSSGSAAMFIGLVLGGLLAPIDWRLIFLVSVPFGLFGTVWSYLQAAGDRRAPARADRLARQPHLRARADPRDDRDHLRDPPLRQRIRPAGRTRS